MNKKGIELLASSVIKLIVAIIVLGILFTLGFKLFEIIKNNNDLKIAEGHMEQIEFIIFDLESEGGGEREYILLNPGNWVLTGWPFTPLLGGEEALPNKCNSEWNNCLCFCEFSFRDQVLQLRSVGHQGVLDACEEKETSLCIEIEQEKLTVNGKRLLDYKIFPEKSTPILVSELVEEGKAIVISLSGKELRVDVK